MSGIKFWKGDENQDLFIKKNRLRNVVWCLHFGLRISKNGFLYAFQNFMPNIEIVIFCKKSLVPTVEIGDHFTTKNNAKTVQLFVSKRSDPSLESVIGWGKIIAE
jgi:hypothetical protein